jgi:hypothetical protein
MVSRASITNRVLYLQLVFLSATWLAGIYVNGFVAILPGEPLDSILLTPAVASHIFVASLSAVTGFALLPLVWKSGARRAASFLILADVSIVIAGLSGLAFLLGGASDSWQSMSMASAFITAFFLTFLSLAAFDRPTRPTPGGSGGLPFALSLVALACFYGVFTSGIYVNLFVAGPVFSLPLGLELSAFKAAERTAPFIFHEVIGALTLAALGSLSFSLWSKGMKRLTLVSALPVLFVAYSAYVGSLNVVSPLSPVSGGEAAVLIPMLSAAALISAMLITMLVALRTRSSGQPDAGPAADSTAVRRLKYLSAL